MVELFTKSGNPDQTPRRFAKMNIAVITLMKYYFCRVSQQISQLTFFWVPFVYIPYILCSVLYFL